jgi:Pretoxin HINT domain
VLLASGAAIPISQLKPGDQVMATNTKTGKTQAEAVTAVMAKRDTDKYDLTIQFGRRSAVIDTTRNHLFWDVTGGRWVKAGALRHGDRLRTPGGTTAAVVSGRTSVDSAGWMWDISVPGGNDHDFYIDTAVAAVLVHNCPTNLGRGSTGRTEPANLKEQLAMEEAQSNPAAGRVITRITMSDPRWLAEEGWVKMQQNVNGLVIHYVYNPLIDAVDDFKFVP